MSPSRGRELWDIETAQMYAAERFLKQETSTQLKRFLSGGSDELAKVQAKIRRLPEAEIEFRYAILNPDPSKIKYDAPLEIE